jgi:deazaflavin-dependent oxidoreductase (nitroreductase family)
MLWHRLVIVAMVICWTLAPKAGFYFRPTEERCWLTSLAGGIIMSSAAISVAALLATLTGFLLLVRFLGPLVARFNRAVANPITRQFATRAPGMGVVIHSGRKSGRVYRTPVNVFKGPEGFSIALTYGRNSDWVRNVLAAGRCELETRGVVYQCSAPAIVHDPSRRSFQWPIRIGLWIGGAADYLRLSISQVSRASA